MEPGELVKSYTVMCATCHLLEHIYDHVELDNGKKVLYKPTVEMRLKFIEGWKKINCNWVCWKCLHDASTGDSLLLEDINNLRIKTK